LAEDANAEPEAGHQIQQHVAGWATMTWLAWQGALRREDQRPDDEEQGSAYPAVAAQAKPAGVVRG
jgi:hypothetical protein